MVLPVVLLPQAEASATIRLKIPLSMAPKKVDAVAVRSCCGSIRVGDSETKEDRVEFPMTFDVRLPAVTGKAEFDAVIRLVDHQGMSLTRRFRASVQAFEPVTLSHKALKAVAGRPAEFHCDVIVAERADSGTTHVGRPPSVTFRAGSVTPTDKIIDEAAPGIRLRRFGYRMALTPPAMPGHQLFPVEVEVGGKRVDRQLPVEVAPAYRLDPSGWIAQVTEKGSRFPVRVLDADGNEVPIRNVTVTPTNGITVASNVEARELVVGDDPPLGRRTVEVELATPANDRLTGWLYLTGGERKGSS
jgi:hypothetical protein